MAIEHIQVGVVVERRATDNPWIDHVWTPVAVLPDVPAAAPWTVLARAPGMERYYAGEAALSLFKSDTGHLITNFVDAAKLWVSVRPTGIDPPLEVVGVTADPSEGEGYLEGVGDIVEVVPMPPLIAERVLAFFEAHHVERPFVKRQRDDRAKREAFGARRGPPR
jgi:hypothetical protein